VAKTVKKMRDLAILPTVGLIKPTDKIAVGSFIEEVEEMHRKTIDPVTGRLFMKHSIQDDLRDKEKREKHTLERKIKSVGATAVSAEDEKLEDLQREIAR